MGRDRPDISEGLPEAARVAIGIVVGLTIAFTIAIISLCLVRISTLLSASVGSPVRQAKPSSSALDFRKVRNNNNNNNTCALFA